MRGQRVPKTRVVAARGSRPRLAAGTGAIRPIDRDSERRVEDFATIVHDLKNPLATIALEAYILEHALSGSEHAELRRVVARITSNVAFVDRMVDNLLDSYSLDAGHFEIRRRPTELRSLLEDVVDRIVATPVSYTHLTLPTTERV